MSALMGWFGKQHVGTQAAVVTGVVTLVGGIISGMFLLASVQLGKTPTAAPAAVVPASAPVVPGALGTVRRMGILVLQGDGTAYDLDSLAADWGSSIGQQWVDQNISFVPVDTNGKPLVQYMQSPWADVVMSGRGPWTYFSCADAPYGANPNIPGPNVIEGSVLKPGTGICVKTEDAPKSSNGGPKTDGGRYGLLVVQAITPTTLTLDVTIWN